MKKKKRIKIRWKDKVVLSKSMSRGKMTEEKFKKYIEEIDSNSKLEKRYLINDLIKIRVHALLKSKPPECGYHDCNLPIDTTPGMSWDTSCPYHRLLFDHWLYTVAGPRISHYKTKQGKRSAFTQWVNRTGKKRCDEIVDEMSNVPINWKC